MQARTSIFRVHRWSAGEEINSESRTALQPRLHANLLDPAPRVRKPGRQLREVHPAVVSEILLLGLRRVRVGLVLLDPFHEYGCVAHSPNGVRERCLAVSGGFVVRLMCRALIDVTVAHNTSMHSSYYAPLQRRCISSTHRESRVFMRQLTAQYKTAANDLPRSN